MARERGVTELGVPGPAPASAEDRALICVTTCNRVGLLRRYLPHLARFCRDDPRFHLLVALDGDDPATRTFCEEWEVPLVHSDVREGVGLSKNRVLERYGEYPFYFFLDDDVELVDGRVFPAHIDLFRASGIHHFSLFARGGVRKPVGETRVGDTQVLHGLFGGGQFSFFSGEGLRAVGGWHPDFARYRRWGHTEHSYRFYRAGLAPAPFNVAEALSACCLWHYPPAVARVTGVAIDEDQIPEVERALLDQELTHVPLTTLAPHHTNGLPPVSGPSRLGGVLDSGDRYPLVGGGEKRRCRSDFQLWRAATASGLWSRVGAVLRAALQDPANPTLRTVLRGGWKGAP